MLQLDDGRLVLILDGEKLLLETIVKVDQTLVSTAHHPMLSQTLNNLNIETVRHQMQTSVSFILTFVNSFFLSATVLISFGSAVIKEDNNLLQVLINGPHSSHLHQQYH